MPEMRMNRRFPLLLVLALAACSAPPIESARLAPPRAVLEQLPINTALFQNVSLGQVAVPPTAEEEHVAGNITSAGFREALQQSLLDASMLARPGAPATYRLDARMTQFTPPGWGFTFIVPSEVEYALIRLSDNQPVWHETLRAEGQAGFGDAFFNGVERRRIAISASVRENVAKLIEKLSQQPLGGKIVRKPAKPTAALHRAPESASA